MKKLLLFTLMLFTVATLSAQTISGTVLDGDTQDPVIGASVMIKGTPIGTITDIDGKFTLNTGTTVAPIVEISYIGFKNMLLVPGDYADPSQLGLIKMAGSALGLEEVTIVGIVDIARDRKTPVAVSTISAREIAARLGNQELPEILRFTPSIYTTKAGGGFGDSRINVRGFTQENTAVLVNGVPVNDMENGAVYWSNWTGLSDVASAIQVQRGLGSSKIAISSVGGTVNIVTKVTDVEAGGKVSVVLGNDGYNKVTGSYSTGRMKNGFAVSALMGRTAGNGYAQATNFEGYNFFLGMGWSDRRSRHNVQFVVTGAPQVHNQRTSSFFNMATLGDYEQYGRRYNYNAGTLDGEEFNWRRNFYHKPIASLNYDVNITDKTSLSSVVYASYGRGGGTGDIGRLPGFKFASDGIYRDEATGQVNYDGIASYNGGNTVVFSDGDEYTRDPDDGGINDSRDNGLTRRASINSHNWLGSIVNLHNESINNLSFDVGLDLRTYKGIHYRRLDNLLGSNGYNDNDDINNPDRVLTNTYASDFSSIVNVFKSIDDEEKIDYYNDGLVNWLGAFGQMEYSAGPLTAFLQGSVSNQGFRRIDYFQYEDSDPLQTSDWKYILGGNIKGGANFNINENHNVFGNLGYYGRQPNFDAVFRNFQNEITPDDLLVNEKVIGAEFGYGFRSKKATFNMNLYRTSWADRFFQQSVELEDGSEGLANFRGITQVHQGIEFDGFYKATNWLRINGMLSLNDWRYKGDVTADVFDDSQTQVGQFTLFLNDIPVGDAAQTTARLGIDVKAMKGLSFDFDVYNASRLYADYRGSLISDFGNSTEGEVLRLPNFTLMDAGISYAMFFGKSDSQSLRFRFNMNNIANTLYISESATNVLADDDEANNYLGVNKGNKVFIGFGRTWNTSITYTF